MRKKDKAIFVCNSCGNETLRWQGKCPYCNEWNTLKEVKIQSAKGKNKRASGEAAKAVKLNTIENGNFKRISAGIREVDRVLGNGIVPGSIILLSGDPGIGKSTLLLQLSANFSNSLDVLYVSGEESAGQVKMRTDRLGLKTNKMHFLAETDVDNIITEIANTKAQICIIDSIQTMFDSNYPSTPGSIVQVRECALKFQQLAKSSNIPIILVGHVTKDGEIAGPKTLEHLVDVVLYLEGERYHNTRILRGVKNRFGATDEIGIFEMAEQGLKEIDNPSEIFLKERLETVPGSVVTATIEGTRPFLVEIQALTNRTNFGYPRRACSGLDFNRLQLLIAVLQKRAGLNLSDQDIYINVVGGFKIKEPAVDLAVCLAIASAYGNKKIESNFSVFGEVGLSGEIRTVAQEAKRENESKRLGFNKVIKSKTLKGALTEVFR